MQTEEFTFKAEDGTVINAYKFLPKNKAKAAVYIAHGMAEHSGRYLTFTKRLVCDGYAVYANDHRGHGKTAGSLENIGYFADKNGWNIVLNDIKQFCDIIKENHSRLFLFGHSMGSFLVRNYIYLYGSEINGALLSGTAGNPGLLGNIGLAISKLECIAIGKKSRSILMAEIAFFNVNKEFEPRRTDFDWLTSDNAEVDNYINDPLCGEIFTAGFYDDMLTGLKNIHKPENIKNIPKTLPLYIFSGDKDPIGKNGKAVKEVCRNYKNIGIKDITCRLYKNGRHDMLHEIDREEVFNDIISWLNNHS